MEYKCDSGYVVSGLWVEGLNPAGANHTKNVQYVLTYLSHALDKRAHNDTYSLSPFNNFILHSILGLNLFYIIIFAIWPIIIT